MIQHYSLEILSLPVLLDIEEDLNQLGDLSITTNGHDHDELKQAKERIRQLEDMVETLK